MGEIGRNLFLLDAGVAVGLEALGLEAVAGEIFAMDAPEWGAACFVAGEVVVRGEGSEEHDVAFFEEEVAGFEVAPAGEWGAELGELAGVVVGGKLEAA